MLANGEESIYTRAQKTTVGYVVEPGVVSVIVPVGTDSHDGNLILGRAELSVNGVSVSEVVTVLDFPEFATPTNGQLYIGRLEAAAAALFDYEDSLDNLVDASIITTADYESLSELNDNALDRILDQVEDYDATNSITVETDDSGSTMTLGVAELNRLDRAVTMQLAAQNFAIAQFSESNADLTGVRAVRVPDWNAWWENAARPSIEAIGGNSYTDLTFGVWESAKDGADKARRYLAYVSLLVASGGTAAQGVALNYLTIALSYISKQMTEALESGNRIAFDSLRGLAEDLGKTAVSIAAGLPQNSGTAIFIRDFNDWLETIDLISNGETVACRKQKDLALQSSTQQSSTQRNTLRACPFPGTSPSPSDNEEPPATLHACADPLVPTDASWKFFRFIFGGGFVSYPEKDSLICYGNLTYFTYLGNSMDEYVCDAGWKNCRRSTTPPLVYTDIVQHDGWTQYLYDSGWGDRTPE